MKIAEAATDVAYVAGTSGLSIAVLFQWIQLFEAAVALLVAIILGVLRIRKHLREERNSGKGR